MAAAEGLSFLRGTFSWSARGFFFASPPPMNLLTTEALSSPNPWIVLAAVLEHAKRGNHSHVQRLREWFHTGREGYLDRICIVLTGDLGRVSDVRVLPSLMEQGSDSLRSYACEAAAMAGHLWLIPPMLDAWRRVGSLADHETIGFAIAALLEPSAGPISANAGSYELTAEWMARVKSPALRARLEQRVSVRDAPTEFESAVLQRFRETRDRFGTDEVVVWQGERFDIRQLAENMYSLVHDTEEEPVPAPVIRLRHKFEGTTGIDCSSFFRNGAFQPLAASEILESFLDNDIGAKYQEGVRYFFGHRIPD